jgi:membrane protein implicated in regulation of membrane protease activity
MNQSSVLLTFEAVTALLLVVTIGVVAAFVAGAVSGDRATAVAVGGVTMLVAAVFLTARIWRLSRLPRPVDDDAASE